MNDVAKPSEIAVGHWYLEDNPLLRSIPKFSDPGEFAARLSYAPLAGLDVSQLDFVSRHDLLVGEKMPLQPTAQSIRAALTWSGMLRVSYQVRNPLRVEARRAYWNALNSAATGSTMLPAVPVGGMSVQLVKGPTGTAKTATAKRFCQMLGPQCLNHGVLPEAGWKELKQLVYLYSDLSHDGSRGGFLTGLLVHVDRVLGTQYAETYPRVYKSLDRLAVATVGRLIAHYTGIVFVDEGQLRNLMQSDQAELMQVFLLSLMNSGIPLVLMGNERAFDWINFSQDLTRLKIAPSEYFHPVGITDGADAETDANALYHGVSSYYLLDVPPENSESCKCTLLRLSGGIGRVALTIWSQGQLNALLEGRDRLTERDLITVYESHSFDDIRPLCDGFAKRLPELLLNYPDVDAAYYARVWGKPLSKLTDHVPTSTQGDTDQPRRRRTPAPPSRRTTGKQRLKAEQTRKANACAAREALLRTLDPEDLRATGISSLLLTELTMIRQRIAQEAAN